MGTFDKQPRQVKTVCAASHLLTTKSSVSDSVGITQN